VFPDHGVDGGEIALGRGHHAQSGTHYRLGNKGHDVLRSQFEDFRLEFRSEPERIGLLALGWEERLYVGEETWWIKSEKKGVYMSRRGGTLPT
jgi:hypothetical protein